MKSLTKDELGIMLMALAFYKSHMNRSLSDPEEDRDWTIHEINTANKLEKQLIDEYRRAHKIA